MKRFLNGYTTVTDKICYYVCYFSMLAVIIMMLIMTVDVLCSHLLNTRILGAYEVTSCLLSTLVFSSWAYTQTQHGHIHVVMFIKMFPQKLRFVAFGVTSALSTVVMGIATYAVYLQILAKYNNHEATPVLMIPHWPFYVFELVAFGLMTILLLLDTVKSFVAMFDKEEAEELQKNWV